MRTSLFTSVAVLSLAIMHPGFALAQTDQTKTAIPPGITEAQPGQPAAPHGQAMDEQNQATRAEDATAGQAAAGQVQKLAPGQPGHVSQQIPPGITEAQPGQPAAPHGQAMDEQHQATRAEDAAAGAAAAGQVRKLAPGQPGHVGQQIPPGITEAQPGQPAAPHGQAMDEQHQATRGQDAAAGQTAAGQVQQPPQTKTP